MLIKISTSQVKTSALYRKQIEIYCERLRKKNQFNPVVISGLGGGGGGGGGGEGGTPELR